MESAKIDVIEPNDLVKKYRHDLFRRSFLDCRRILDDETLKEHERQMQRLLGTHQRRV